MAAAHHHSSGVKCHREGSRTGAPEKGPRRAMPAAEIAGPGYVYSASLRCRLAIEATKFSGRSNTGEADVFQRPQGGAGGPLSPAGVGADTSTREGAFARPVPSLQDCFLAEPKPGLESGFQRRGHFFHLAARSRSSQATGIRQSLLRTRSRCPPQYRRSDHPGRRQPRTSSRTC